MNRLALYMRTVIFGVTDSLVSTVGLLAGLNAAGAPHRLIVLTGVVYALVEAFSMAVGDFLSEESAEEYTAQGAVSDTAPLFASIVMFFTFAIVALIPVAPYLLLGDPQALGVSIILSIFALFVVGAVGARFSRVPMLWRGARMALLGGGAILIGIVVGAVFPEI
ncbi:MAG: VIT1/CCC1 transporter family protein [bacterium]|nr:VIT1/CCC1 transporter family protein [bacterium]